MDDDQLTTLRLPKIEQQPDSSKNKPRSQRPASLAQTLVVFVGIFGLIAMFALASVKAVLTLQEKMIASKFRSLPDAVAQFKTGSATKSH
ncbi:MAG: hypothetical protein C5B53_03010 [Candidatus Melainabacteria bacterium]|nr:MAG: hypothetical protein C5B53_03010 [Candidatus Melainabacteria bacterium]